MWLAKMNQNGQVTIPAKVRGKLALRTGELLRVDEDPSGRIVLTPVTLEEKGRPLGLDLKKYEAEGVDISLITANLRLTPSKRLQNNKRMLELIESFQRKREGTPP